MNGRLIIYGAAWVGFLAVALFVPFEWSLLPVVAWSVVGAGVLFFFIDMLIHRDHEAYPVRFQSSMVAVLFVLCAGQMAPVMESEADRLEVRLAARGSGDLPPGVALMNSIGGPFRGIAVVIAWQRLNRLKEAGDYAEVNQLSRWIAQTMPGFPSAWAFHAWNMAYNVSVETHTPEERWYWVNRGVIALRDDGIRYNPRSVELYRELGRIFIHKIAGTTDDQHYYYKLMVADEWHLLLGRPIPYGTAEERLAPLRRIADAPDTLGALRAQWPQVDDLIAAIRREGWAFDKELTLELGRLETGHPAALIGRGDQAQDEESDRESLLDVYRQWQTPERRPTFEALLSFLRKQAITGDHNMDIQFMLDIQNPDSPIGVAPVDWRHPASHAYYWSAKGVDVAFDVRGGASDGIRHLEREDLLNTDRQVLHALQMLAHQGVVIYQPETGRLRPPGYMPNTEFILAYHRWWKEATQRTGREGVRGDPESLQAGHENYLQWSVATLWMRGLEDDAERLFLDAKELYEDEPHNRKSQFNPIPTYEVADLRDFVEQYYEENYDLKDNARGYIQLRLSKAFIELSRGSIRDYLYNRELALMAYENYMQDKRETAGTIQGRRQLPPFEDMEATGFAQFLLGTPGLRYFTLSERSRAWMTARDLRPPDLPPLLPRILESQFVVRLLERECESEGRNLLDVFPPPGMP